MSASPSPPIALAPPPWTLKGTLYTFPIYVTPQEALDLSENQFIYAPLEAKSGRAEDKFLGGLATVQIFRYSESPAGPYDELLIVPGKFEYDFEIEGQGTEKRTNLRVSRIYVSQEKTCWNGRKNWNIPKHLAHFKFQDLPNGATKISVYPLEPDTAGIESRIPALPFFSATYKDTPYFPSFPSSTETASYFGLDLNLVQPPLPEGRGALGELPGTDQWCKLLPVITSPKTSIGWWDMKGGDANQEDSLLEREGNEATSAGFENWWPGIGRWRFGMKMEDATILFGVPETWGGRNGTQTE
ncbi:hypothetical protein HYFRA_00010815 [Hymenoscyphus fraxineus]|uniref:Uncharacterized protein n=1 Tax=Hymenoscyphus fraxineus TaxID=746836 RepID=A0A9N9L0T4_9HELO|nr:hypothetical protein HYFRA_00010815 [Hymenoscyphus fraxineus]